MVQGSLNRMCNVFITHVIALESIEYDAERNRLQLMEPLKHNTQTGVEGKERKEM